MLFNSFEFIFIFLPVVFLGFFWSANSSHRLAALWLAAASLFFYGWWNSQFVMLLLASIGFNYAMGYAIGHARTATAKPTNKSSRILAVAIVCNLLVLGYFKYINFFIATSNQITDAHWSLVDVVLPLGISFFTFTQIAFLVDVEKGIAREYNFIHYLLFVTYFPHLIAGPVLHHKQMMPQFGSAATFKVNIENVNIGLTTFIIGLFKKVILADQFALYANPVFDAAASGGHLTLIEAWIGALAYTLQLYFDFSGYSDMAIGLSGLFNVKLPLNFASPYKARNIIEFWRRWHMTLSVFLKDYLYVPLGGNRKGTVRRYGNLMTTMLLGGLWHGAGWNFALWGVVHGTYLVFNHAWHKHARGNARESGYVLKGFNVLLTFCLVVIAWVPFRAADFDSTLQMLAGMFGANGTSLPGSLSASLGPYIGSLFLFNGFSPSVGLPAREILIWLPIGLGIVWGLPNTQQWIATPPAGDSKTLQSRFEWRQTPVVAVFCGVALAFSILGMTRGSQFLYFQF